MTSERILACRAAELPPGSMRRVDVADAPAVAVYNIDGAFYATADRCTHARASLTEGDLEGDCVVCPVHFGVFHVPTGRATCFPLTKDLATFPVEVDGDAVYVVVDKQPDEGEAA